VNDLTSSAKYVEVKMAAEDCEGQRAIKRDAINLLHSRPPRKKKEMKNIIKNTNMFAMTGKYLQLRESGQ